MDRQKIGCKVDKRMYSHIRQTHWPDPGVVLHRESQLDQHDVIEGQAAGANPIVRMADGLLHWDVLHIYMNTLHC